MWSDAERGIFELKRGGSIQKYDPGPLVRAMNLIIKKDQGGWQTWFEITKRFAEINKTLSEQGNDAVNADDYEFFSKTVDSILAMGKAVFGVKRFCEDQESGWTDGEILGAIGQFNDWLAETKKKEPSSADSSTGDGSPTTESLVTPITLPFASPAPSSNTDAAAI